MRHLNGVYTQAINRAYGCVGHLFQGRFKGILVQKESYLVELARYIVLNPVRAGMTLRAEDWPWSSYRATAGLAEAPPFLTTDWILSAFAERYKNAVLAYRRFVAAGVSSKSPWIRAEESDILGLGGVHRAHASTD